MSDEQEHLENLLLHPGFLYLQAFAQKEFADKILDATEVAANDPSDAMALNKLRQLIAGKRAVHLVLNWPTERLRQLKDTQERASAAPSLRRGGQR